MFIIQQIIPHILKGHFSGGLAAGSRTHKDPKEMSGESSWSHLECYSHFKMGSLIFFFFFF